MTTELERAIGAVLDEANRKFDAAIADLQPPPMTFAEALGALTRAFHETTRTIGIALRHDFDKGYNQPAIPPYTIRDPNPTKIMTIPGSLL